MKDNKRAQVKNYLIVILITIGFYIVSMNIGSLFNVIVAFSAGYRKYADFMNSDNLDKFVVIGIFCVFNHLYTSWLTVKLIFKYCNKYNCISLWLFRIAAVATVAFTLIIVPLLNSKTPGKIIIIIHSIGVWGFGTHRVKKYMKSQNETFANAPKSDDVPPYFITIKPQDDAETSSYVVCRMCGTKVDMVAKFCHKCGFKMGG